MKRNSTFRVCALAAILASLSASVWAGDRTPSAEEQAAQERITALNAIATNRDGAIAALVSQWESAITALGYPAVAWAAEFTTMLHKASPEQLLDIENASDYNAVRAILQGRSVLVTPEDLAGPAALGDTASDLLYTPVTPCRIQDTRYDSDGATMPPGGTTKNFIVYGTAAQLAPQGHTAGTGCASPKGEPAGIAANFTAVP